MLYRKLWSLLFLIVLLWLATGLRVYRLDAQSFWNDEGNSARLSERSPELIVEGAAGDVHPPLYYLLLRGWRGLLGQSEFSLRALSAFSGMALVAAVFTLGKRLWPRRAGPALLAVFLAAVNPALVYYSQEARMYQMLGLWTVLCTIVLWRLLPLLSRPRSRQFLLWGAAYVLMAAAGLYTHYFFPTVLLAHNLILLRHLVLMVRHRQRPPSTTEAKTDALWKAVLRRWSVMMVAALLLYSPWLPIFLRQVGGRSAETVSIPAFLGDAARWLVLGHTVQSAAVWWSLAAAGLMALLAFLPTTRQSPISNLQSPVTNLQSPIPNPQSLISILILLPILLMLAAGTTRPAYHKFMIVAVPFLALLLAWGLWVGWRLSSRVGQGRVVLRGLFLALLALLLLGSGRSLANMYLDPTYARADYRGIAAQIAAENHPNAGIILNAANQWEVFTYYHDEEDGAPVYPLPRGKPDAERIAAELEQIAARHDRLYALFWGEAERDPQRLVERWLDANAFKAREEWVGDVRFVTYAVPSEAATDMETRVDVTFGRHITLQGYTLQAETVAPGDIIQITLYWQAQSALDTRYKVFLHLLDEQGRLVAQRDAEPGGNLALTTTWQPGQTIVDNHGVPVPAETAPGSYRLRLGLYPLSDPAARLPVDSGDQDNAYPVATITVR